MHETTVMIWCMTLRGAKWRTFLVEKELADKLFGKPVYNSYLFLEDFKFALTAADIITADQAKLSLPLKR